MEHKKSVKVKVKKPKKLTMKQSLAALAARVRELENHPTLAGAKGATGEQGDRGAKGDPGTFRWWWE